MSRFVLWKSLIVGLVVGALLLAALFTANTMKGVVGRLSINLGLGGLLAVDVWVVWSLARHLRSTRRRPS